MSPSAPPAPGAFDGARPDAAGKTRKKAKGARVFQCAGYGDCKMTFSRSEHLVRHIRKHTAERPFHCHCGRLFSRLDNLRQHIQTVHANDSDSMEGYFTQMQQHRESKARPKRPAEPDPEPLSSAAPSPVPYPLPSPMGFPSYTLDAAGPRQQSPWQEPQSSGIQRRRLQQSLPPPPDLSLVEDRGPAGAYMSSFQLYSQPLTPSARGNERRRSSSINSSASSLHSLESVRSGSSGRSQTSIWLDNVLNNDPVPSAVHAAPQVMPGLSMARHESERHKKPLPPLPPGAFVARNMV